MSASVQRENCEGHVLPQVEKLELEADSNELTSPSSVDDLVLTTATSTIPADKKYLIQMLHSGPKSLHCHYLPHLSRLSIWDGQADLAWVNVSQLGR